MVMTDEAETRYRVEDALGWAAEFEGREVALSEKTWAAGCCAAASPYLLDHVAGQRERHALPRPRRGRRAAASRSWPIPCAPATGPWAPSSSPAGPGPSTPPPTACSRSSPTRRRPPSPSSSCKERHKELAARDGLTGLYNRRSFDELLAQAVAREDRKPQGSFALLMLDLDHFKKLNDTFGHPAGDAALKHAAATLLRSGTSARTTGRRATGARSSR